MAIVDYSARWKQKLDNILKDKSISEDNKKTLKKFWMAYNVSEARKDIFLGHIIFLLQDSKNIIKDMQNRDKVNRMFNEFRKKLGNARYITLVNISCRFVRWLNDNNKPKGFTDVKSISSSKMKRKLMPNDMITWEDNLNMSNATNSIQIKAVIPTQLDGGFRPSEFESLNYGDAEQKKEVIVVNVRDGKTGQRLVILYRAAPYLSRWLMAHPTKKKSDPLWIREFDTKARKVTGSSERYAYTSMAKRVKELGKKIKLDKPLDFYNFRHSACVLAKLDNLPLDECAKKFGHSVKFFTETYGRLTTDDSIERITKVYGLSEEKAKIEINRICPKCEFKNVPSSEICERCSSPLSLKKALEMDNTIELQKQIDTMQKEKEDTTKRLEIMDAKLELILDTHTGKLKGMKALDRLEEIERMER